MRGVLGDAEGFCLRNVFVKSIAWAQNATFDTKMSFVFDNRPNSVVRDAKSVFDTFQLQVESPRVTDISFASSTATPLLQAADLFAWEMYQYANEIYANGGDGNILPSRQQLKRFSKAMDFPSQFANRDNITKIVDHWKNQVTPDHLRQMADHYRNFDPSAPDYSRLTASPPAVGAE